jgi:hypothetical protein
VLYRLSYLGTPFETSAPRYVVALLCGALEGMATLMGLEPTTFAVTGRRSNQLSYSARYRKLRNEWWARLGLNQRPPACEADALPLSYAPALATAPWTKPYLNLPLLQVSSTENAGPWQKVGS